MYLTACHLKLFYPNLNIKVYVQNCPFVKLVCVILKTKFWSVLLFGSFHMDISSFPRHA